MPKGLPRSRQRGSPQTNPIYKKKFVVKNATFPVTGATGVAQFATLVIGDFPQGNILFLGAVSYMAISGPGGSANLSDTWDGDMSIGTAPTADTTLNGAEVNIIASAPLGAATAEVHTRLRTTNATAAIFDNTDDSLEVNLNILVDADMVTNAEVVTFNVNGEVDILYTVLGDD